MGFECYPNHKAIQDILQFNYIGRKPIYDFLLKKAPGIEGRVLDFGCGSLVYKPMFQKADEYIGLDIEDSVYNAKDECVVHYDGRTIPFEDESFDCVYSIQVLDDIEDLDYSVLEIARVLKRGASLCVLFRWHTRFTGSHMISEGLLVSD